MIITQNGLLPCPSFAHIFSFFKNSLESLIYRSSYRITKKAFTSETAKKTVTLLCKSHDKIA
jgi:hypothetical protein